jgi:hypothetical protein
MLIQRVLLTTSLSLGLFACAEKSSFKSGVPKQSKDTAPQTAVDSSASTGGSNGVDDGSSVATPPSKVEDLGALTDKHSVSLKVDVVFAIDTSASMGEEIAATQTNMGRLISALNNGRLDSRIHLMLDQLLALPAGVDATKVAFINQRVDSNDAISRLTALFAGTFNPFYTNAQGQPLPAPLAFRKDAKLEIVVISDDNGQGAGNLAADFDPTKTLKATFNSIIGLPTSVQGNACELSGIGMEYMNLSTASNGSVLDICSPDWSMLITRLSNDIVKRSVTFALSKKPSDPKALNVTLDGKRVAPEEWTYNAQANAITLTKTDAVKDGSQVTINYNPAAN